jgi:hypothetical protein
MERRYLNLQGLKEKIEWMLNGNFLTDKDNPEFAYGINLRTREFYSIHLWSVTHKRKSILIKDVTLPLEDIANNMVIYKTE